MIQVTLSPSRRLLASVATASLLLGGLAFANSASADACPTYTDPADDAGWPATQASPLAATMPLPTDSDDDLDILAVSHSVDDGVFSTVLKIKGLRDTGPNYAFLDRFNNNFTVAGKVVQLRADRDFFNEDAPAGVGSLRVGGTLSTESVAVVFNLTASTVTLKITVAALEKAVATSLAGKPFSAMSTASTAPLVPANPAAQPGLGVDTATAPATASYVFGASCSGGGTPTPGPTGEPTGEPTAEPTPEGPPPLFAHPRAGCFLYKDDSGDAYPTSGPVESPETDPDLDLTQVSVKTTDDALVVYSKITALGDSPETPIFDGHKFSTSFVINAKTITATAEAAGAATTTPATAKATAAFDKTKSFVIFTFPAADLAVAAGIPLAAGTPVTNLTWASAAVSDAAGDFDADTAAGVTPAEKSYSVGDNTCFQPPSGIVTLDTTGRGVFGDTTDVGVLLTDADENAITDAKIRLQLTGMPEMTLLTDEEGIAEFSFPVTVTAGNKTMTARFLGSPEVGAAAAGAPFTVAPETTVLKAVGGKGSVTATLTDNDKKPVVGQAVAFKVGSKVTKVTTNAKGVAVLSRQAAGTSVSVSFAAVTGKYAAAKAVTAKVL